MSTLPRCDVLFGFILTPTWWRLHGWALNPSLQNQPKGKYEKNGHRGSTGELAQPAFLRNHCTIIQDSSGLCSLSVSDASGCLFWGGGGRSHQIKTNRSFESSLLRYLESASDFPGTQQVLGARGSRKNMPCAFLALNEFTVLVTDLRPGRIQPWDGWNSSAFTFLKYYMWIQLGRACFPMWP